MKLLFLAVLLTYLIVPGTSLKCFQCALSPSLCINKATCDANELCYSGNATLASITIFSSGCTNKENCGKEITQKYLGLNYRFLAECCNYDYCNGATAAQLSLLAVSVMALAWFVGFQ
ncbi:sperm acrosome membrane-associated protein 4-like isoform X1 [Pristis pectinata]|uniref:sperm acrosome membrane-associated protein 4-like isoform X1 n=1 Tax=Pristis pectinata TaxID=685728 RepID=UPI00223E6CAD|nr:sperm acrosome membrane-associated protein 4-like isoform X1 [Pristis pectinata]